jgi:hypothetical protein
MPEFIVKFSKPVNYLEGHHNARLGIRELIVLAPNATGAMFHAVRVCTGDVSPEDIIVEPYERNYPLPPVEVNYEKP